MNINLLPQTESTTKVASGAQQALSSADASDDMGTIQAEFASLLSLQQHSAVNTQLSQLGKQLNAAGQAINKNTLAQAIVSGEENGSLTLDDEQLNQLMSAVQQLPVGNFNLAEGQIAEVSADDAQADKSDDSQNLSVQALFAMFAAQPAQEKTLASAKTSESTLGIQGKKALIFNDTTAATLTRSGKNTKTVNSASIVDIAASAVITAKAVTNSKTPVSHVLPNAGRNKSDASQAIVTLPLVNSNVIQKESYSGSDNNTVLQTLGQTQASNPLASNLTMNSMPDAASRTNITGAPQIYASFGSSEWQQELSQQVVMFNRHGQQTAELRLNPQDLGSIQISLKMEGDQVQLHFVSNHGQVRAAIESAMPHLRTALADNGISLGESSVASDSSQWQQAQQQNPQSGSQQQGNAASWSAFNSGNSSVTNDVLPVPESLKARANGSSSIDIFA